MKFYICCRAKSGSASAVKALARPLYDFCGGEQCVVNIASAISQTPAVATAEAITDISGWLIPASVIQELIVRNKEYQKMIFSLFTLRYGALTTLIEDIKFKRLDSRILDLLHSFGTDEITIKNAEIAERLGTSRNVINCIFQNIEAKNLSAFRAAKSRW